MKAIDAYGEARRTGAYACFEDAYNSFHRLIWHHAQQFTRRSGHPERIEEAVADGRIGLWRAIKNFEAIGTAIFETYAVSNIRGWIKAEGYRYNNPWYRRESMTMDLVGDFRVPNYERFDLRRYGIGSAEERTLAIDWALAQLSPQEATIIRVRFLLGGTANEAGAELGMCRRTVCKYQRTALDKLQVLLRDWRDWQAVA